MAPNEVTAMAWRFHDARGIEHVGIVERTADHGGTDVTYFMRDEDGRLHVLSGSLIRDAHTLGRAITVRWSS